MGEDAPNRPPAAHFQAGRVEEEEVVPDVQDLASRQVSKIRYESISVFILCSADTISATRNITKNSLEI